jgi:hypothetical protein
VRPVRYSDLHVPATGIPSFLNHLLAQESEDAFPGLWTRHLCIEGDDDHDYEYHQDLLSLILYMPHLVSFSARNHPIGPPLLVSLKQKGTNILRALEVCCHVDDANRVILLVGRFKALHRLRFRFVRSELAGSFNALCPLSLRLLRTIDITVTPHAFPNFFRWLRLCEFDSLRELHISQIRGDDVDVHALSAISPFELASFFRRHQEMRTLALNVYHEPIVHFILSQTLPPGLTFVDFRLSSIPRPLPNALPRSVRCISIRTRFSDLIGFQEDLDHLLLQAARHELPPELRISFNDPDDDTSGWRGNTDFGRFQWETCIRPASAMNDISSEDTELRGLMLLYALQFKRYGISVVDEDGYVWPTDGEAGQLY